MRIVQVSLAITLTLSTAASVSAQSNVRGVGTKARFYFLDVGKGRATIIQSPEGLTALVDAGPSGQTAEIVRDFGIKRIDMLILGTIAPDHYGGVPGVIQAFSPGLFLAPAPFLDDLHIRT